MAQAAQQWPSKELAVSPDESVKNRLTATSKTLRFLSVFLAFLRQARDNSLVDLVR
jgi:hypothetical protein